MSGGYLTNAMREMERSSFGVRDEAKMERRTAGVTGMPVPVPVLVLVPDGEGGFGSGFEFALAVMVRVEVADWEDMVVWERRGEDCHGHHSTLRRLLRNMDRHRQHHRPVQLFEDSLTINDRLPSAEEAGKVKHLMIGRGLEPAITDDAFAEVVGKCTVLETAVLCGVEGLSDRSVVALARGAGSLRGLDVSGCVGVTDVGVQELVRQGLPLEWVRLGGIGAVTDPSVSELVRGCGKLVEVDVSEGRMLGGSGIRDVWVYARGLRVLRVGGCVGLTDDAFPAGEKPLPGRPGEVGPLVVHHRAENLRVLDLSGCAKITDEGVEGIVGHAGRIQTLILSGCVLVTDVGLESVGRLGGHLDVLGLGGLGRITDEGIVRVSRRCRNLRSVDVSCESEASVCVLGADADHLDIICVVFHSLQETDGPGGVRACGTRWPRAAQSGAGEPTDG